MPAEFITESADKPKTIGRLRLLRMRKYSEKEIKRAESFLSFLTNTNRAMRAIYAQQGSVNGRFRTMTWTSLAIHKPRMIQGRALYFIDWQRLTGVVCSCSPQASV